MNKLILIACFFMTFLTVQAQVSITGEYSPRAEFRNGYKAPMPKGSEPAFFVEQRARLSAGFINDKYEVKLTLQDIRMWGADGQIYKTSNSMFSAVDAWGKYNFDSSFAIKVGRQMISCDNQRFFGGLEWAMQGRRHDAVLFLYEKNTLKIHLGGAFNQNPNDAQEPNKLTGVGYTYAGQATKGNYKHMEFVYLNKKIETVAFSLYLVNDARQYGLSNAGQDSVSASQTYLAMANKEFGPLKIDLEGSYQGGKRGTIDVSAYMFSVSGTMKTKHTPITLGYDYLSGTSTGERKDGVWDPSFGTNHGFYGFMDYFYVGNPNSGSGLQDVYLKTKFKLGGGNVLAHVHYFAMAADIAGVSKSLGTEIDLVFVKKLTEGVTWNIGYSHMFATNSMRYIKSVSGMNAHWSNNWAWTQLVFTPTFL
jgi:hypothetical protein